MEETTKNLVINHEIQDILYITTIGFLVMAHSNDAVPEATTPQSDFSKTSGFVILDGFLVG